MLYKINETGKLESISSSWNPSELKLEEYLITSVDSEVPVMSEKVFGEPLLLIRNQPRTATKKRADILALDRFGNSVIIELKRDKGRLGVETQALQYLADFSGYKGKNFLKKFSSPTITEVSILGFVGDKASIDEINARSRVILIAQEFDEAVFSIGEWLSTKGVAFRCITYTPIKIGDTEMISFSIAFDQSPGGLFPLLFSSKKRSPGIYWHNIAKADQAWWDFLRVKGQIPAGFDNSPGDQGEKLLKKYIKGDQIVAYATGFGAVGWGIIENPKYRLIPLGDKSDEKLNGDNRHRINIKWKATVEKLKDGLLAEDIRKDFGIYHPIQTSVSIDTQKGSRLIEELNRRFQGTSTISPMTD